MMGVERRMCVRLCCVLAAVALSSMASAVAAAPIINVGNHILQPDLAGQTVQIFVSGGDAVQGLNFNAQVADGGPGDAGGVIDGPNLTHADIITGTIFATNNSGEVNPGSLPQIAIRTTTTNSGTVAAEGLLATLTVDTTGFLVGTWDLKLAGTLNGNTDFAGVPAAIVNGTITIVPEPHALGLAGLATLGLMRRRSRA